MRKYPLPWKGVQLCVRRLNNGSFTATILRGEQQGLALNNTSLLDELDVPVNGSWTHTQQAEYDSKGALYYVVAVVFIYGFSIILMIGSLIRKSDSDRGMNNNIYMQGLEKARRVERRREKFKVRLCMQSRRMQKILGADVSGLSRNASARGQSQEENPTHILSCEEMRWPGGAGANQQEIEPLILPSDAMADNSASPSLSSSSTKTTGATPRHEICIDMYATSVLNYEASNSAETSSGPLGAEELTKAQLATLLEEDEEATLL